MSAREITNLISVLNTALELNLTDFKMRKIINDKIIELIQLI